MNNFFTKKYKYENSLYILFSIIIIIYGLIIFLSDNLTGVRIFSSQIIGLILFIISLILLITKIIFLTIYKNQKLSKILFLITIILISLVVIDFFILGIIRSFIEASTLTKAEQATKGLNIRIAYICIKNKKAIFTGIWTTIWLSLAGTVIGLILGLLFITLRTLEINPKDNEFIAFLKKLAQGFVKIYVTVFRGTPMMVQAIIIYYFLPVILSNILKTDQSIINNILSISTAGLITVSLNTTAYLTEVLRGGIESLNKGQMEASRSLGMTRTQAMIYIILPQGIKNSLPAICNEFIINIKDTSVLSVISVMDLFFIVDTINGKNMNQDGIFIAAIIYLCLTYSISKILGLIEKKMNLVAKPLPSSN